MPDFFCHPCDRAFGSSEALAQHTQAKHPSGFTVDGETVIQDGEIVTSQVIKEGDPRTEPDWEGSCDVCGQSPIVPLTGMCGPCTFGEADTLHGNW